MHEYRLSLTKPRGKRHSFSASGNPCNIREAHPCQDEVDPRYVRWIYTSARPDSLPCLLFPFRLLPLSCSLSLSRSFFLLLPLSFFVPLFLYSYSPFAFLPILHLGDPNGRTSFRIPSSFPTPMLVCSLVKRNGQAMSVAPQDLWNLCYGTRSQLLQKRNASRSLCRNDFIDFNGNSPYIRIMSFLSFLKLVLTWLQYRSSLVDCWFSHKIRIFDTVNSR